ncbi:hypothetical protein NXW94_18905 [Bacteroides ovatus]|nr:hypothetical protein [Bacteroides ovatus]
MISLDNVKKIEFYNLDIYSTNKGGNFVIYLDNQGKTNSGSVEKLVISSCMIRDFRGVIRVRKTTSNANTTIEIDDCIIKGLQGGHYGILHASDITGSSGAGFSRISQIKSNQFYHCKLHWSRFINSKNSKHSTECHY